MIFGKNSKNSELSAI